MTGQSSQPDAIAERLQRSTNNSQRTPVDHGHYHIRITRDGEWHYRGTPILRPALVKLFASVLCKDPKGQFWLQTPVEKGRIDVDDVPFTAVALTVAGSGRKQTVRFLTNLDETVPLDMEHPLRVGGSADRGGPAPYVMVRDGLEALIVRPVYYELVELGENGSDENADRFGVWSNGKFFGLGDRVDAE